MPEWVVIAMNSIGDQSIGFEDEAGAEDPTNQQVTGELGTGLDLLDDIDIDQEVESDEQESYGAGEIDDAIRALEEAESGQVETPTMNSGAPGLSRTSGRLPYWTCLGLARRLGRIGTLANA